MVDKEKAIAMRREGYSVASIANYFGATIGYIYRIMPADLVRYHYKAPNCIYPSIRDWLIWHGMSVTQFSRLLGVSQNALRLGLIGRVSPTKYTIDAILTATGLTYEQAFGQKESAQQDSNPN